MPYWKKYTGKNPRTGKPVTRKTLYVSWVENQGGAAVRRPARDFGAIDWESAKIIEQQKRVEAAAQKRRGRTLYLFDQLILDYLEARKSSGKNIVRPASAAKHLALAFEGWALADVSGQDIRNYVSNRRLQGVKDSTIIKELSLFSAAWNYAIREWDWPLPRNPVQGRKPSQPEGRDFFLTQSQVQRLIEAASTSRKAEHLVPFIQLSLHTAIRSGEALGLEWVNVQLDRRQILLVGYNESGTARAKTGKKNWIPINDQAHAALVALQSLSVNDSPWVFCHRRKNRNAEPGDRINSVKGSFKTAVKKAGLPSDTSPHILRHTAASWLAQAGVPMQFIAQLLRQSTKQTTARYAHLSDDSVLNTVNLLGQLDQVKK